MGRKYKCRNCGTVSHVRECPNCNEEEADLIPASDFERPGDKFVS